MECVIFTLGDPPCQLQVTALPMGQDWNISITGGTRPHLGAAALSVPYPKPEGGVSASTSVMTALTHKEDHIARATAERLAKGLGRTVAVCCGIHVDGITPGQLAAFGALAEEATGRLLQRLGDATHVKVECPAATLL